jgi:hypothetical protein
MGRGKKTHITSTLRESKTRSCHSHVIAWGRHATQTACFSVFFKVQRAIRQIEGTCIPSASVNVTHLTCDTDQQIRGAIQEYQMQLFDSVKEDVKHLH